MPRTKSRYVPGESSKSPTERKAIAALPLPPQYASCVSDQYAHSPLNLLDTLVERVFFQEGIIVRITPDRAGQIWSKACIRTRVFPRHYLLTSHPPGTPLSVCLRDLAEKVQAFKEGRLKPSPDKFPAE